MADHPWPSDSADFFRQETPHVYFRLPGSEIVNFWPQESENSGSRNRFYFVPFATADQAFFFSSNQPEEWSQDHFIKSADQTVDSAYGPYSILQGSAQDEEDKIRYLQLLDLTLNELKEGNLKKVVLSRPGVIKHKEHPLRLFVRAIQRYPDAFCYLYFHPQQGCWLGASPEILIKKESNQFETYSLAGTQKKMGQRLPVWTEKEKDEQAIVTDYIQQKLSEKVQELALLGPENKAAGELWHLRTILKGKTNLSGIDLAQLLHPSPAVCGLPQSRAQEFILAHEGYERSYYTGYLGPDLGEQAHLYVNLRCMKLLPEKAIIYVGGGVTPASVPEKEWQETHHKMQTMLQLFSD